MEQDKLNTELPMSSNKDISETKQVTEGCGLLNQERVSLDNSSIESSDTKCNSPPSAPNRFKLHNTDGKEKIQ